jgi:septal ring factor EnvC (AmiA/AmiB activator)
MAGEQSEAFPDELRDWVERAAAADDADPETILARAVATYRYLDSEADDAVDAEGVSDRIETLADRVAAVEDDLDEKIEDVRSRVVQVKRESDAKAARDHDHPALDDRIEATEAAVADAEATVADLEDRLDRGFENYEEILEYLTDATDDLDRRIGTLSEAVADVRTDLDHVVTAEHGRRAVDDLRTAANRHGQRSAACGDCESTVDVALLSRPRCPHCEATFVDFEPSQGFFGSATLATGDRPALAAGDGPTDGADSDAEPGGPTDG